MLTPIKHTQTRGTKHFSIHASERSLVQEHSNYLVEPILTMIAIAEPSWYHNL